jgi:hypothetical protein
MKTFFILTGAACLFVAIFTVVLVGFHLREGSIDAPS